MSRFKVKVCGLTRVQDAELVSKLGVDMIGLIFYRKSPRFVSQSLARKIAVSVDPTVARVGVFVDEPIDRILKLARTIPLDYIQLHGFESNQIVKRIQREGYRVIKAFAGDDTELKTKLDDSPADLLLLDNISNTLPGGSGKQFDWNFKLRARYHNLVLSGGISIRNVEEGIRKFHPLMIDVNSGVESSPGVKSARKLKQFFNLVDKLRYGQKA